MVRVRFQESGSSESGSRALDPAILDARLMAQSSRLKAKTKQEKGRETRIIGGIGFCPEEVKCLSRYGNQDIANSLYSHFHVEAAGLLKRPMSRKNGDFDAAHRPSHQPQLMHATFTQES